MSRVEKKGKLSRTNARLGGEGGGGEKEWKGREEGREGGEGWKGREGERRRGVEGKGRRKK